MYRLVIHAGIQVTPGELALPVQIEALFGVAQHVHALVGVELFGHILIAERQVEPLLVAAPGHAQKVVAHVVGRGADHVAPQVLAGIAGGGEALEVASGLVIVGLGQAAVVADGKGVGAVMRRETQILAAAVGAVARADLAAGDGLARRGELWRGGFHVDRAADGIAANGHGRHARIDRDAGDLIRRDIRQHRVHVIGATGDEAHAVELDVEPVVGQAIDLRQTAHAPRGIHAQPGQAVQQTGGVAGPRPTGVERGAGQKTGPGRGGFRRGDHHGRERDVRSLHRQGDAAKRAGKREREQTWRGVGWAGRMSHGSRKAMDEAS